MCEQQYHGVVRCALGWACWKTYLGRPEADQIHGMAMNQLGRGLSAVRNYKDALSVQEAELTMLQRLGASERDILITQGNLSNTYSRLGRLEEALRVRRDVYSRHLELNGEEHETTLVEAYNLAYLIVDLEGYDEARSLLRKTTPVARRVLGESKDLTLRLRWNYARALFLDGSTTLDDLRKAVTMLKDVERIARRVFGGAHPFIGSIEQSLKSSRAVLGAREELDEVENA